jgi:hypothetical protein
VPIGTVVAKPGLVGAIYFVSDATVPPTGNLPRPTESFREFALCNEAMIESWEVGTDQIAAVLAANAATLEAMARYLEGRPTPETVAVTDLVRAAWGRSPPNPTPEIAYAAALALASSRYALDPLLLLDHAGQLRVRQAIPAFEGRSTVVFTQGGARNPPHVIAHPQYATYGVPPSPTAAKP